MVFELDKSSKCFILSVLDLRCSRQSSVELDAQVLDSIFRKSLEEEASLILFVKQLTLDLTPLMRSFECS